MCLIILEMMRFLLLSGAVRSRGCFRCETETDRHYTSDCNSSLEVSSFFATVYVLAR